MRISVTSNIAEVLGFMDRLSSQFPFAVAKTLTEVARAVERDVGPELSRTLDKPTSFTTRGTHIVPARKTNLESTIGFKDRQAKYLRYQIEGGQRQPEKKALRLPSEVQLDAYGNVPAGLIRQLVARAKAGRRATKVQGKRFGVSQQVDLFYGDPKDGRPAGIYKRVVLSTTRHQLIPIIVFPQQPAKYRQRFDFYGLAQRVVAREFNPALERNWQEALRTAK